MNPLIRIYLLTALCWMLILGNTAIARASNDVGAEVTASYEISCGVDIRGQQNCTGNINISGTVGPTLVPEVEGILSAIKSHQPIVNALYVHLDSGGGLVSAALQLGRLLRRANAITQVGKDARCVSACVLVFVAGAQRLPDPPSKPKRRTGADWEWAPTAPETLLVGIHRPYMETAPGSVTNEVVRSRSEAMRQTIRAYLREMNVSEQLGEDMMTIPSDGIRWLTVEEMARYGMLGVDPVIEETRELQLAQRLGITRIELLKREAGEFGGCYAWWADQSYINRCVEYFGR